MADILMILSQIYGAANIYLLFGAKDDNRLCVCYFFFLWSPWRPEAGPWQEHKPTKTANQDAPLWGSAMV